MIEIEYLPTKFFSTLRNDLMRLENGQEMTYFQTFSWHSTILPVIPKDCSKYESRFVVLKNDGVVKIIAPIWVVKRRFLKVNEPGVFFIGRGGWSDYLNFIYDEASTQEISFLLNSIVSHYNLQSFYIEEIPGRSKLYDAVINNYKVSYKSLTTCISIRLPSGVEDYQSSLSKHTRQNLRTAINRMKNDDLDLSFVFDDYQCDKSACARMRKDRLIKKSTKGNTGWIMSLKLKFFNLFRIKFRYRIPFKTDKNSHVMTAYIGEELAAFFSYGIDEPHKRIVIMAAGVNEKYEWYSPGLLLAYNFVLHQINSHIVDTVDFTRGNERYKYSLGGVEHYNYNLKFTV